MIQFVTHIFDSLESTNTEALRQARLGANEGTCIIAREQSSGRGRHGRTWVSPKNAGLYFSIVLRPRLQPQFLPLITLMAGVAVHDMLQEYGMKPDIKWVNDVLVGDRKIAGILAETVETEGGIAVVVGIGINLTSRSFPPEITDTATSIEAASAFYWFPRLLLELLQNTCHISTRSFRRRMGRRRSLTSGASGPPISTVSPFESPSGMR